MNKSPMRLIDLDGHERDFFFAMSEYAGFLYPSHIARHLAYYELYKKTARLPGSIAEFGVFNGSLFFFLARLLEIFHPAQYERTGSSAHHLYGFDTFNGIPGVTDHDVSKEKTKHRQLGGFKSETFTADLKWFRLHNRTISPRIHTVEGDIFDSWPRFLQDNPGVRFRLAVLDLDLYEPTSTVLSTIYDRMVPGGILVFDEYGFPEWPGETKAVDEFLKRHHLTIHNMPSTFAPSAYVWIPADE